MKSTKYQKPKMVSRKIIPRFLFKQRRRSGFGQEGALMTAVWAATAVPI